MPTEYHMTTEGEYHMTTEPVPLDRFDENEVDQRANLLRVRLTRAEAWIEFAENRDTDPRDRAQAIRHADQILRGEA